MAIRFRLCLTDLAAVPLKPGTQIPWHKLICNRQENPAKDSETK
jgi:hypothetical protein